MRSPRPPLRWAALLALLLATPGCWYYSLTGATIPAHITTIAVPLVVDRSVGAPAGLDQRLTELLIDRFAGRTRLTLVSDENAADAVLYAEISRYATQPVAVTGGEVAALNRVTISVDIRYMDRVEDRERLARAFSQNDTYNATDLALAVTTADRVLSQIADDVFTAATSDW
jgi:hypothetical protein